MKMESKPATLAEAFQDREQSSKRENPENLSNRGRLIYEIEKVLHMENKDLQTQVLTDKSEVKRIYNQDLYRIFRAICQELSVEPRLIYTGNSFLETGEAKEIVENTEKTIEDLETDI